MGTRILVCLVLQIIVQRCQSNLIVSNHQRDPPVWVEPDDDEVDEVDWSRHPCRRACKNNEQPKTCRYKFRIEHYYTMSRACYDCPYNITDCFRPHCVPADGVDRPLVVVNRQMPGPAIEVCESDKVIVDVRNMLHADATTVHWHGLHMKQTPYMDGTPFISQCPIQPGDSFQYKFYARNPGTHFWHSHIGFQRGDGLFGPVVIRQAPRKDRLSEIYDHDLYTISIIDWDHELGLEKFLAHYHSTGDNKPPNILVNGLGRHSNITLRNNIPAVMPLATFNVKQHSKHRFRIINAGVLNCPIEMSIDNHSMYIVSSDGRDLKPVEALSLVSYAGERFDIVVEMDQKVGNYWMRFRGLLDCGPAFDKVHQEAILRYEGSPEEDPKEPVGYDVLPSKRADLMQVNPLNKGTESQDVLSIPMLEALDKNTADITEEIDYKFYITYDFYGKDNRDFHRKGLYGYNDVTDKVGTPQLNHITNVNPPFSLMSQTDLIESKMFCNTTTVSRKCEHKFCSCLHVNQVELDSIVEIVLIDEGVPYDANHPFHLHGHSFRVVAMERLGSNITLDEVSRLDRAGRIKRKLDHAPIKDTVTVPDGGYTIVRFKADNPGYWLFHCHIEFHSAIGMSMIFKVGKHRDFVPVPRNFPRCNDYPRASMNNNKHTQLSLRTDDDVDDDDEATGDPDDVENDDEYKEEDPDANEVPETFS